MGFSKLRGPLKGIVGVVSKYIGYVGLQWRKKELRMENRSWERLGRYMVSKIQDPVGYTENLIFENIIFLKLT